MAAEEKRPEEAVALERHEVEAGRGRNVRGNRRESTFGLNQDTRRRIGKSIITANQGILTFFDPIRVIRTDT
jgi:hypothetical protein